MTGITGDLTGRELQGRFALIFDTDATIVLTVRYPVDDPAQMEAAWAEALESFDG